MSDEREFFYAHVERAAHFGFKPGFAAVKFKEHFGQWPPDAWSKDAMRFFVEHEGWQARVLHRGIEKEHYETWEREIRPLADARKAEWFAKHPPLERVSIAGLKGSLCACWQSEKRARPIHAFIVGETSALCGKSIDRWLTGRKPFTQGTEYGCKKCKKVLARKNQLALPAISSSSS